MIAQVRVWVAGPPLEAQQLGQGLRDRGLDVEGDRDESNYRPEAEAARWADVIVIMTSGGDLDSAAALLAGIALGARRPLLFIADTPVESPALATLSSWLSPAAPVDAIAFQIQTLGTQAAVRRSKRQALAESKSTHNDSRPRVADSMVSPPEKNSGFSPASLLEARVFEALDADPGVRSLAGESIAPGRRPTEAASLVDLLVWVDGAAPFNPVPVEIKSRRNSHGIEQVFSYLHASGGSIGVLVTDDEDQSSAPIMEEKDGALVIVITVAALAGQTGEFSRMVRGARNVLAHGTGSRGEI